MDTTAKSPVLHTTKLFGGVKTAHEIHVELAWNNRPCYFCKGPPFIRLKSLITVKDLERYNIQLLTMLTARYGGRLPCIQTIYGPALIISDILACRGCAPAAERAAAHGPSWIHVEIDRGPGEDPIIVQVPGAA